ncbi:MAG TPA: nucleotidyltransferase family protein [Actinomycetota bacterium]
MADWRPVEPFLRELASFGVPGGPSDPLAVPDGGWPRALSGLVRERLTGIAAAALKEGALKLSEEEEAELLDRQQEAMCHALALERELLRLARAFADAGVELIVLKGPAVAHTIYPDPSWRPFGDLDVLVRTADWRRACSLLPELGYRRRFPEPRPGFVERFGHTAAHQGPAGLEVDLHRTLVGGPFGLWMDPDELFDSTETFELGGRTLRRLDDTALLMHAFVHAALGHRPPLLLPLRDVAQAASSGVDRARLADWGRRWRLSVVYRHASRVLSESVGVRLPEGLAPGTEERPSRRERRALDAYTTARRDRGGKSLGSLRAIRGLRAKAAYLIALLFPSREFLQSRSSEGGPTSYRRRWATPLRWMSQGRSRGHRSDDRDATAPQEMVGNP